MTIVIKNLGPELRALVLERLKNLPPAQFVIEEGPRPTHEVMADCVRRDVEHITGVAIRRNDRVFYLMWPCRHCHVLHMLAQTIGEVGVHQQGFVTSSGRFVGRIEGAALAIAAGQITALRWPPNLYSEDLW